MHSFFYSLVQTTLSIYLAMLIIRALGSWVMAPSRSGPTKQGGWTAKLEKGFGFLSFCTDPYLNLFRRVIPPIGGLDISPMIAFLVLRFLSLLILGMLR